ncbi:MAG: GAF domain-containing protein [Lysobacter sp.]|nr:GAF domain-containing protein [Lysobacter sp.]
MNDIARTDRVPQRMLDFLQVLDRPPLAVFEHVVQVASTLTNTPIALVSLVDRDRVYFMARTGFDIVEAPGEGSFCRSAIANPGEMLEVRDARLDARFATSPQVTGVPGIRFYAGIPLVIGEDEAIGTLCVIDRVPRVLTESQRVALDCLAQITIELLEARRRDLIAQDHARQ